MDNLQRYNRALIEKQILDWHSKIYTKKYTREEIREALKKNLKLMESEEEEPDECKRFDKFIRWSKIIDIYRSRNQGLEEERKNNEK